MWKEDRRRDMRSGEGCGHHVRREERIKVEDRRSDVGWEWREGKNK